MKKKRAKQIKVQYDINVLSNGKGFIEGWFDGKNSYLWLGDKNNNCIGTISKQKLYTLAKKLVIEFEENKTNKKEKIKRELTTKTSK